jgi:hypothetical protein
MNSAYAARLIFAHLARCATAIFRRADADRVRLAGFGLFAIETMPCARALAQRNLWAAAILLRAETESVLRGSAWIFPSFSLLRTDRAASTCFRSFSRFVLCNLNCKTTDTNPGTFAM